MFGRKKDKGNRVPVYLRADCIGAECDNYQGQDCDSRFELFEAPGKSGGKDKAPLIEDCSYAKYGRICMGGEEQVVIDQMITSPNADASLMELVGRGDRHPIIGDVLTTPAECVIFPS